MFESTKQNNIVIRKCQPNELALLFEMARIDGRNPGLHEQVLYTHLNPDGVYLALIDNEIVGAISGITYGSDFGFIGLHMVHPEYRNTALAAVLLQTAKERMGNCSIGLNCHKSQIPFYERFGFKASHSIFRYHGNSFPASAPDESIVSPFHYPFAYLQSIDGSCFPYNRQQFLYIWLNQTGSMLLAKNTGQAFSGYGLSRPCIDGMEISNLLCTDEQTARSLFFSLTSHSPENANIYLNVPEPNRHAVSMAEEFGMQICSEHIRMYCNATPKVQLNNIYSFSGLEVG